MKQHIFYLEHPAADWEQGLPVGNGRLGAVILGGALEETLLINEESLWYGGARERLPVGGREKVEEIRRLLLAGEAEKAQRLAKRAMTSRPKYGNPYQPAGNLRLSFYGWQRDGEEKRIAEGARQYRRELNLDLAEAKVSFTLKESGGMSCFQMERSCLASADYEVLALQIREGSGGRFSFQANLERRPFEETSDGNGKDRIWMSARLGDGVSFVCAAALGETDGVIYSENDYLCVENASRAVLYVTVASDYDGRRVEMGEPFVPASAEMLQAQCDGRLEKACAAGFTRIREAHRKTYQALYGRTVLQLTEEEEGQRTRTEHMAEQKPEAAKQRAAEERTAEPGVLEQRAAEPGALEQRAAGLEAAAGRLPADEMLRRVEESRIRKQLAELLFAYGKYLLISSSYRCQLPANLQGIWNGSYTPPWESAYTININTQMNYWFADKCRLNECQEPLTGLVRKLRRNGKQTARRLYGCSGFAAHHNTNLWGDSDIVGTWTGAFLWPMGGAWLTAQLYRHFCYTQDTAWLRTEVWPLLKENVAFFYDYLYRDAGGFWLSGPSVSPENTYRLENGQEAAVAMGCTMDHQIIREVMEDAIEAAHILAASAGETKAAAGETETTAGEANAAGCGEILAAFEETTAGVLQQAREILEHLPPTRIGEDGRILEWREACEETEPGHRHISHLYGLHPGRELNRKTPELLAAARKTLETRLKNGGGHTGWSRAWILCFYARLGDGRALDAHMGELMKHSLYENLWDAHPPFQIDGNFGLCEAIAEALVQCEGQDIYVLPALPESWDKGSVEGLGITQNGYISLRWEESRLAAASLTAISGGSWNLYLPGEAKSQRVTLQAGETWTWKR